jgi:hypothetical protein
MIRAFRAACRRAISGCRDRANHDNSAQEDAVRKLGSGGNALRCEVKLVEGNLDARALRDARLLERSVNWRRWRWAGSKTMTSRIDRKAFTGSWAARGRDHFGRTASTASGGECTARLHAIIELRDGNGRSEMGESVVRL